ncbi:VOC family protein [Nocardia abscessus]|uniref:VOC family protein n=1 Tax=Nocardia abscessus TaxID=120957 RepID=UPI0018932720|nr:VOC family protein [Nocardia abscessus]MBF6341096.1 VOC family protein [Nocardia abscessus]
MASDTAPTSSDADAIAPELLAHWVVKTARSKQMIAWYSNVFGAHVVHEDRRIAFLTWDAESHRLALLKVPRLFRYLLPLAKFRRKFYGIDHLALTFGTLERLLTSYERLKKLGITPVWSINHGPTTSLYYEDPDGIRLEFQTENFPTAAQTSDYLRGIAFATNPIGVEIDPDYLLERLRNGDDPAALLEQGAGTRPGTTARTNKRTITWKTL